MAAAVFKMNSLVALSMCLLLLTTPAFSDTISPAPAFLSGCHEQCISEGHWKIFCNIKCFGKHPGAERRHHHHHHKHKGHHHASDEAKSPSPSSN